MELYQHPFLSEMSLLTARKFEDNFNSCRISASGLSYLSFITRKHMFAVKGVSNLEILRFEYTDPIN